MYVSCLLQTLGPLSAVALTVGTRVAAPTATTHNAHTTQILAAIVSGGGGGGGAMAYPHVITMHVRGGDSRAKSEVSHSNTNAVDASEDRYSSRHRYTNTGFETFPV